MEIGNRAIVIVSNDDTTFDGFNTVSLHGCVAAIDPKAGVCLRLSISSVWAPCFWYPANYLAVQPADAKLKTISANDIYQALRGKGGMVETKITNGAVRSWVILASKATEGSKLHDIIRKMEWSQLMNMYMGSEKDFNDWVEAYDERIRRPTMFIQVADTEAQADQLQRPGLLK